MIAAPHDPSPVQDRPGELTAVLSVARAMTGERDLDRLLAIILTAAKDLTGADRCSVFIVDEERGQLWTRVAQGADTIRVPLGSGIAGLVVETGQVINLEDAHQHPRFHAENDRRTGYRTRSMLAMPLVGRDDVVVGVLQAINKADGQSFGERDISILSALTSHAAVAIETARLVQRDLERQRLVQEMRIARDIQQGLLPTEMPVLPGWRFQAWQRPCDETGGDYHDFLTAPDRIDLVVGDISGHGLGAAMLMSTARASLRALHGLVTDPSRVMERLNGLMEKDLAADSFMTLLLVRMQTDGSCGYVSGGHEPPLVYRAASRAFDRLETTGMLMGAVSGAEYELVRIDPLQPGDLIVACTDGIFEARDPMLDEPWGLDNLRQVVAANAASGAAKVVEAVVNALQDHLGGCAAEDDLTLVVAERAACD